MKKLYLLAVVASLCAAPALAADPIRLCTGSTSGNYYAAGETIKQMAGTTLPIVNVETEGTIDGLHKVLDTGECDAMIGQPDGPVYLSRSSPAQVKKLRQIAGLHREYLHVLCNKDSDIDDLSDLAGGAEGSLAIGDPGSGAWLIWQNIIQEDDSYASVPVTNESGVLALSAVSTGTTKCMLVPAGLKNGTVNEADATFGDTVVLAGANDKDFNDAVGIDGKPLYSYSNNIPSGTYPAHLQTGVFGSSVTTISWNAGVYINTDRFTDKKALQAFVTAVSRASIGIKAEYGN